MTECREGSYPDRILIADTVRKPLGYAAGTMLRSIRGCRAENDCENGEKVMNGHTENYGAVLPHTSCQGSVKSQNQQNRNVDFCGMSETAF